MVWKSKIISTPTEKSVPIHQQDGEIYIKNNIIYWNSPGHTRSPITINIGDIKRMYNY